MTRKLQYKMYGLIWLGQYKCEENVFLLLFNIIFTVNSDFPSTFILNDILEFLIKFKNQNILPMFPSSDPAHRTCP